MDIRCPPHKLSLSAYADEETQAKREGMAEILKYVFFYLH
jgi:hypothetical protein